MKEVWKRYYVILKGGKKQFMSARSAKEAVHKVRDMLPEYEVVGFYELAWE